MKRVVLSIYFILFLGPSSFAQYSFVAGFFPTIDHGGTIVKNLDYSFYAFAAFTLFDFEYPNLERDPNFLLLYLEPALTYTVNKHFSFSAAYVFQRENPIRCLYTNEHRFHLQATAKHQIKTIKLNPRLRFDHRFLSSRVIYPAAYQHRLRYLIGLEIPIKTKKENLYITAYEEVFLNTYEGAQVVFAENWTYAALGIKIDDINKIEPGILYMGWNLGKKGWYHQFYLQFTWISRLDFTKKKRQER